MLFLLTDLEQTGYISLLLCFIASGNNSVVECNLAKVEVASSNLVSRSIKGSRLEPLLEPFFLVRI